MFQLTSAYSSMEYTKVNFNFQYLKYESDEGFFYENTKELDGMSFSDMSFYKIKQSNSDDTDNNNNDSRIGTITIEVNKAHFDNYRRSYKKLQSLLAELMSVIFYNSSYNYQNGPYLTLLL